MGNAAENLFPIGHAYAATCPVIGWYINGHNLGSTWPMNIKPWKGTSTGPQQYTWPEVFQELIDEQKPQDRHDLLACVFRQKVIRLMDLLTIGAVFGQVKCDTVCTLSNGKRGDFLISTFSSGFLKRWNWVKLIVQFVQDFHIHRMILSSMPLSLNKWSKAHVEHFTDSLLHERWKMHKKIPKKASTRDTDR